jgi:DNA-binding NarL/FixJ family response regulator
MAGNPSHPLGKPLQRTIRVLLVDDHAIMRQGLATSLNQEPDIVITGEAADGNRALQLIRTMRPNVVLMDLGLPEISGIEATRIIHAEIPGIRIIGLTMHDDVELLSAMEDAGAVACMNKSCSIEELTSAIRRYA